MIALQELTIEDKAVFERYTKGKLENSGSSFSNMFIWRNTYDTKYALVDGFLVVFYQSKKGTIHPTMPRGTGNLLSVLQKIHAFLSSINQEFVMEAVTEEDTATLRKLLGNRVVVCEERNLFDYVYLAQDLITLSGKKLHSKRNHINKFNSLYQWEYRPLTPDLFEQCLACADVWLGEKYDADDPDYKGEMLSLREAFRHFEALGFSGGTLFVDGKMVAFTIGEQLTDDMALIHIEKADVSYQGAYPMINKEYASHQWSDMTYINREEDLGIPGLRKAKLSYNPYKLIKTYTCKLYPENEGGTL
ncbi:MAG: DUF2156 domain-containing protein [Ruminococcaceae bacterium]|nr:DUF2156 domain-containing protein [Oscillospiraceae bacterium]